VNFGCVVFPGFQALDVFGPLDALNVLSWMRQMNLAVIAETLEPVSTKTSRNPHQSNFAQSIVPTHTFDTAPPLEVLIVPGGFGNRDPSIQTTVDFIKNRYPELRYLITICTGSAIAAQAGILDGKRATSNKHSWASVTTLGPKVKWVSHARWVIDGNIWTSAGVSAGIDVTLAWIESVYGKDRADMISKGMEYERHQDSSDDPFAKIHGLPIINDLS
jgi:transcriptional regulator GlxA family with amidase domain